MDTGQVVEHRRRLEPRPESARLARLAVLGALTDAGRDDLADAATLLVTELVTNAIVHAHTTIDLQITVGTHGVRVEVRDGSSNRPTPRHYGTTATTGRGLELVSLLADRHGTEIDAGDGGGKAVWFELGRGPEAPLDDELDEATEEVSAELTVHLTGLPVLLTRAWQQHADALLRELLLSRWEDDGPLTGDLPGDHAAAGDAFSSVAAALEALGPAADLPQYVDLPLMLARSGAADFVELDALMEHASALAEQGLTLAPPTQPEIRLLRRWICGQVRDQAAGGDPQPWLGLPESSPAPARASVVWDPSAVHDATEAVIAGDDANRIVAASPAALDLLGWDEDLVGQRIVAVIPERLREAHIASFTMHLLSGEKHILDQEVTVDAMRRDGTEVPIRLTVRRTNVAAGRVVFTATMRAVSDDAARDAAAGRGDR
jgi:PAS domain S-box-containing protein